MNNLTIANRDGFVNTFLGTISRVAEDSVVNITETELTCLCSTSDGTLVQLASIQNKNNFEQTLNVPDIKRLHKIIGCIDQQDNINLSVDINSISYKSPSTRFKFYLLDDGILSTPAISVEKINNITFDTSFSVDHDKLTDLIKGSTYANESEKLYIYTDENNHVYGELTDKEKPNMDSFSIKLCDDAATPIQPIAFNFENIRIVSSTRVDKVKFNINTQLSVAKVDLEQNNCHISYIISGLIK